MGDREWCKVLQLVGVGINTMALSTRRLERWREMDAGAFFAIPQYRNGCCRRNNWNSTDHSSLVMPFELTSIFQL